MAYEGNRYAGMGGRRQDDKGSWLKPVGTVVGGALGSLAGPGGMMAGAQLGGAAGNVAHDAVNGSVSPQSVLSDIGAARGGWNSLQGILDQKGLVDLFRSNPGLFKVGFASGGPVIGGNALDLLMQMAQQQRTGLTQTPEQISAAANTIAGPALVAPTVDNGQLGRLQQAQHPTLEALSGVASQLLAAMPKPANPRNTRAIGAWLPALGVAVNAPASIAQGRRAAANAPLTAQNEQAQSLYEENLKARNNRLNSAVQGTLAASKAPMSAVTPKEKPYDELPMSLEQAVSITGDKQWAGRTLKDYNAYLERIRANKPAGGGAGGTMSITDNVKELGDRILSGELPPSALGTRMTAASRPVWEYIASQRDANGRPYDVARMIRDWQSGNTFFGSMNSRISIQQRGAATTLFNTLNTYDKLIDDVARRVPQGTNKPLNELIQLVGRNSNMYGPDATVALRQLSGADKTIVSELAQVLSAGGVPTDEARQLAKQEVDQYWGKMPIKAALQQIKHFTRIRLNAMYNQTPYSIGSELGDIIQEPDMWNPGGVVPTDTDTHATITFMGEDGRVFNIPAEQAAKFRQRFPKAKEVH